MTFKIWIDADGCPWDVKEIVSRAAQRRQLSVVVVANRDMKVPASPYITKLVVPRGLDMADNKIVEEVQPADLVITADIPLAALVVGKGATALDPRGELYTEANVRERLSIRDAMHELRAAGVVQGGSGSYGGVARIKPS